MTFSEERGLPNWVDIYRDRNVKEMPWYYEAMDDDLKEALEYLEIFEGDFLDLGTGPGTQAIQLSKIGFTVTGSDISYYAIERAKHLTEEIFWTVDDILESQLKADSFDYVFDRGCFHVLDPDYRGHYVATVSRILREGAYFFLKVFSNKQKGSDGPYRFAAEEISQIFNSHFTMEYIKDTIYQGAISEEIKALFIVMKKN